MPKETPPADVAAEIEAIFPPRSIAGAARPATPPACAPRCSETGRAEGPELERRLAERARVASVRIIGPNCMGLLYPAQGISFRPDMPPWTRDNGLLYT